MSELKTVAAVIGGACALLLAGCAPQPPKPSSGHLGLETAPPAAASAIPAPVQVAPVLPPPKPAARPETYSVVVSNVRVQDLLFALARDARLDVDVHPGITGTVTMNAIDQTLPQLLERISRQVDMRYEIKGSNLIVMRDTPYLRIYRVDYVNMSRDTRSASNLSTQIAGGAGAAGGGTAGGTGTTGGTGSAQNNSTASINSFSANKFWETLVTNIKEILRETDKIIPKTGPIAPAAPAPAAAAPPGAPAGAMPAQIAAGPLPVPQQQPIEFIEQASVIANPETGVLTIRATSRQHEKVQEFLDQVLTNAKRQVLIEATVAEVQLNNEFQRGIDWTKVPTTGLLGTGWSIFANSAGTPAAINTNAFSFGFRSNAQNFNVTLKLLESFGDVRVLSSPKMSVLNNQTAMLKVVDNLVYFTIQAQTTQNQTGALQSFTTTPNTVAVGFTMSIVPQISENDSILINLRPMISRKVGDVSDPNPSLAAAGVTSNVPVIQTREMESVLRLQSGEFAVMGGLMQEQVSNTEDGIPGVHNIPLLGALLSQRKDRTQKTELVIFLRATVVRDASIEGDYQRMREFVPGADFFLKPNPGKVPPSQ